ncbi:MAG: tRNA pseudouridine(38-40) synthase TruA [Bacteroidales bacterium]|nr:tRNA pseudouridine(38-40) synthase TruA [Bacteroidales bacterium]
MEEQQKKNRYFIHLSYNGKNFHGWQIQNNAHTVQAELNKAFSLILREEIYTLGCGRTDTGVHARNFYAHFDTTKELSIKDRQNLTHKLNRYLRDDLVIYSIIPVHADSNTRFDATARTYKYYINQIKDPFATELSYFLHGEFDIHAANEACKILFEYEDFTCFSKSGTQTKTNNCKIKFAQWEKQGDSLLFTIKADRFLRNMVRAIVGTMIDIAQHKITLKEFRKIIEQKNRSNAGYSVPGHALFLEKIDYPEEIFIK